MLIFRRYGQCPTNCDFVMKKNKSLKTIPHHYPSNKYFSSTKTFVPFENGRKIYLPMLFFYTKHSWIKILISLSILLFIYPFTYFFYLYYYIIITSNASASILFHALIKITENIALQPISVTKNVTVLYSYVTTVLLLLLFFYL